VTSKKVDVGNVLRGQHSSSAGSSRSQNDPDSIEDQMAEQTYLHLALPRP
jgi:hypothetical protein